jgi:shikimate kinase
MIDGSIALDAVEGMSNFAITLIGPGGAGKSTAAALIAERLGIALVDLDRRFADRAGDISEYINRFGYDAYTRENVETYRVALQEKRDLCVAALSSGFMTYRQDVHPEYARLRRDVEQSPTTFVLIPSLNYELCVTETVRRQLTRPFAGPPTKEEAVIRERFRIYVDLPIRKIETMQPLQLIVDEIVKCISPQSTVFSQ